MSGLFTKPKGRAFIPHLNKQLYLSLIISNLYTEEKSRRAVRLGRRSLE
jgi:hypothetical protein